MISCLTWGPVCILCFTRHIISGGCKKRTYCSSICQKKDWREDGHKEDCRKYQAVKKKKVRSSMVEGEVVE